MAMAMATARVLILVGVTELVTVPAMVIATD